MGLVAPPHSRLYHIEILDKFQSTNYFCRSNLLCFSLQLLLDYPNLFSNSNDLHLSLTDNISHID